MQLEILAEDYPLEIFSEERRNALEAILKHKLGINMDSTQMSNALCLILFQ